MTKEEKIKAMYSSYRNMDEDFGRCGCCHKPLITCQCNPTDVEDDEPEDDAPSETGSNEP